MRDYKINAGERLTERDFLFNQQIGTLTLEALMGLFLHDNDYIARLLSRVLISLTVERVLAIVRCAFVD